MIWRARRQHITIFFATVQKIRRFRHLMSKRFHPICNRHGRGFVLTGIDLQVRVTGQTICEMAGCLQWWNKSEKRFVKHCIKECIGTETIGLLLNKLKCASSACDSWVSMKRSIDCRMDLWYLNTWKCWCPYFRRTYKLNIWYIK